MYLNDTTTNEDVYEKATNHLVKLVRDGTIYFPYNRYFQLPPQELFNNLKEIDLQLDNKPYRLYSYYPLYKTYLPPKFRGNYKVIMASDQSYELADVISDYYVEHIRLKAKRYDQEQSILECWKIDSCLAKVFKTALNQEEINPKTLRQAIYDTIAETKVFNPTWAKALLKLVLGKDLAGKKWLDISSGWGDRLITAMAMDMSYLGYDPNVELQEAHSQMIADFGDPNKHKVIYEPFETANIPDNDYDVVLSSPPYFNLEDYAPNQTGQSIVTYPTFDKWMVYFLFKSLKKAWDKLKIGGYLILHLGDAKTIVTVEATNIFIEKYLLGSSWEGVIGLQGTAGYARPVWVWKKATQATKKIWTSKTNTSRTLYATYPNLHAELFTSYGEMVSPSYVSRLRSVDEIKNAISQKLGLPLTDINKFLLNNLAIYSILQIRGKDETVTFLSSMIEHQETDEIKEYPTEKAVVDDFINRIQTIFPPNDNNDVNNILSNKLLVYSLADNMDLSISWATQMIRIALDR